MSSIEPRRYTKRCVSRYAFEKYSEFYSSNNNYGYGDVVTKKITNNI